MKIQRNARCTCESGRTHLWDDRYDDHTPAPRNQRCDALGIGSSAAISTHSINIRYCTY